MQKLYKAIKKFLQKPKYTLIYYENDQMYLIFKDNFFYECGWAAPGEAIEVPSCKIKTIYFDQAGQKLTA